MGSRMRALATLASMCIMGFGLLCAAHMSKAQRPPVGPAPNVALTQSDDSDLTRPPRTPLPDPLPSPRIVVHKAQRRLRLYSGETVLRVYRIGLGFAPEGHKARQGDGRTPEGSYYVCCKNPKSTFYLALGVSYPNAEDAARGLPAGLITQAEHDQIVSATQHKQKPPWNTALGGDICIHGHGSGSDWTLGCVALDDEDVREVYNACPVGTPVIINP